MAPVAHPERRPHGSEPSCGEDQPERSRRCVQLVLHDIREQHFARTEEDEVGRRRSNESPPQPHSPADEREALPHRARVGDGRRRSRSPRRAHRQDRDPGDGERRRVDGEGQPGAGGDQQAPEQRAGEAKCDRADELVERVRGGEVLPGKKVGDDRLERRREECSAGPIQGDEHDQLPQLKRTGEDEHGEAGDRRGTHGVCREHQAPAVVTVAEDAADE